MDLMSKNEYVAEVKRQLRGFGISEQYIDACEKKGVFDSAYDGCVRASIAFKQDRVDPSGIAFRCFMEHPDIP